MPNTDHSNTLDPPTVVTWYYLKLPELVVSASPRYIYIPRWKTDGQFALYGDGRLLYQSHASTYWNGWNTPLWIAVDETADAVTPREILIRIERPRDTGGGISSVWLGHEDNLGWSYRIRYGLQIQLPAANSAAFLAVGTFALLLWLRLRSETMYLLFFGISLASFLRTLHFHVGETRLPVSDAWFTWLTINALYWLLLITHLFLNYLHGRPMVWLNRGVIGVTALMGLITLPAFSELLNAYALSPLIYVALLLMGSTVGRLARRPAAGRMGSVRHAVGRLRLVAAKQPHQRRKHLSGAIRQCGGIPDLCVHHVSPLRRSSRGGQASQQHAGDALAGSRSRVTSEPPEAAQDRATPNPDRRAPAPDAGHA
jgi:hypothetical protein